jgi:hypothetical protein
MNISIFMSVFSFLKELVFGKNSQNKKSGISSNIRKWIILILIVASLTLNYFTVTKIFKLTSAYIAISQEKKKVTDQLKKKENCELTLETLQDLLDKQNIDR